MVTQRSTSVILAILCHALATLAAAQTTRPRDAPLAGPAGPIAVAVAPPWGKWSLHFDVPSDFIIWPAELNTDGVAVLLRTISRPSNPGWQVTAFIRKDRHRRSAVFHRDHLLTGARVGPGFARSKDDEVEGTDVRSWEEDDRALLTLNVRVNGTAVMHSRSVVLVQDRHWIEVRMSHEPPSPNDDAMFDAIMRSIRLE